MSTMIERVARALARRMDESMGWSPGTTESIPDKDGNSGLHGFFDDARAAIEAMREPTDRMRLEFEGWNCSANDMEAGYQAAINSALEDTP